jgi:hypothetical protein
MLAINWERGNSLFGRFNGTTLQKFRTRTARGNGKVGPGIYRNDFGLDPADPWCAQKTGGSHPTAFQSRFVLAKALLDEASSCSRSILT